MARRTAHLHVDLAGLRGDRLAHDLITHRDALREIGFKVPVHDVREGQLALVELRRTHREHALRRSDVEGQWAAICRRTWKGRKVPLLSVPSLGALTGDEIDLAADGLAGLRLHLLVSLPAVADVEVHRGHDALLARWERGVRVGTVRTVTVRDEHDWEPVRRAFCEQAGLGEVGAGLHLRPARPA